MLPAQVEMFSPTNSRSRRRLVGHRLLYGPWDIDMCQSGRVSGELLSLRSCDSTQTGLKFGYDQGLVLVLASSPFLRLLAARVMSGIITEPHFINFFDRPSALQVGTIVAVLEIGALGVSKHTTYVSQNLTLLQ